MNRATKSISFVAKYPNSFSEYEILEKILDKTDYAMYKCRIKDMQEPILCVREVHSTNKLNFVKETEVLKSLKHKNIIKLLHSFYDSNKYYMIFEYTSEYTLGSMLKNRIEIGQPFLQEEIFEIAAQILLTLEFIHSKGIVHRNINLDTIIYFKDCIKLTGWTYCQAQENKYEEGASQTRYPFPWEETPHIIPQLMSPELLNFKDYSYTIDTWSLGIILYNLCTLKVPFESKGNNGEELKIQILTKKIMIINSPFAYSDKLTSIIVSMLSKEGQTRINAKDAYYQLEAAALSLDISLKHLQEKKKISSSTLNSLRSKNSESNSDNSKQKYVYMHEKKLNNTSLLQEHFRTLDDECGQSESHEIFFSKSNKEVRFLSPNGIALNAIEARGKQGDLSKIDISKCEFKEVLDQIDILNSSLKPKITISDFMEEN